jgi:hypothetical protein
MSRKRVPAHVRFVRCVGEFLRAACHPPTFQLDRGPAELEAVLAVRSESPIASICHFTALPAIYKAMTGAGGRQLYACCCARAKV